MFRLIFFCACVRICKITHCKGVVRRFIGHMKKLIIKTAFITLGVTLILAIAAFGIVSLCAPAVMMDLTASLGMTDISGDYAYQEYERSREISYLARSFEIAAEREDDVKAQQRFGQLYKHEAFSEYCVSRDEQALPDGIPALSYRGYVCGLAACVEYRLARTDEARDETIAFAVSETDASFPMGNPVIALAVTAAEAEDAAFCGMLLETLERESFDAENTDYQNIVKILEVAANE